MSAVLFAEQVSKYWASLNEKMITLDAYFLLLYTRSGFR